jgi:predicted dehydrogenase
MKIALIEASHWHATLYIDALASMDVRVVGVSDQNPAVAARVAARFGCKASVDYKDMLTEARPDFIFAFGRHRDMPAIAAHLIKQKIPFAMEKPMGRSASEIEALCAAVEIENAFIAVPFVFRHSPIQAMLDELKSAGEFGDLTNAYFRFIAGPPSRYPKADSAWLLDPEESGGGCTINLAVHFLDFSLRLLEANSVSRVYAVPSHRKYGIAVEDFSTVVLSTNDGVVCTVETGYAYPQDKAHLRHFECCLTTTKGYMEIRDGEYAWASHDGSRVEKKIDTDTDNFYPIFIRKTLDDLVAGNRPSASVGEMFKVMKLIDAAFRSGRERQVVVL